jgi:pantothenate synthetase
MYPDGFGTRIVPQRPASAGLKDRFRPYFFGGIATRSASCSRSAGFALDYFEVRHPVRMAPIASVRGGPMRIPALAKIGKTRLIDNIAV